MTTNADKTFTVELTSVTDRDDLVAEVWIGQELLAELRQEDGRVRLQIYADPAGGTWDLPCDDLLVALQQARAKLDPPNK